MGMPEAEEAAEAEVRIGNVVHEDYRTMQDIVFTTLRDEIFSGRLKPGERLNSTRLAERLGVSRMPVREALNRLISVGLLEYTPHRGAYVRRLSVDEVIEIYYVRAAVEGIAARLAVRKLGDEELRRLQQLCDEMDAASESHDDAGLLARNAEFHNIIYRGTQSPRLEGLIQQYFRLSEQYRTLGLNLPGRHTEIGQEHRALATALLERDADRAERASREHHLNTARRIAQSAGSPLQI